MFMALKVKEVAGQTHTVSVGLFHAICVVFTETVACCAETGCV